jgi:hypothetical protein
MGKWEIKKRNGSEHRSETEAKPKAKREHKIREEYSIVENSIEQNIIKETPEPSSGLYQSLSKMYFEWHQKRLDIKPQFDGSDGTALKQIIKYFETLEAGSENIEKNFSALLSNFDKWDKFHQGQTRLRQINSNLTNIINTLKNGKATNGITKDGLIEAYRKRTQSANVDNSAGG